MLAAAAAALPSRMAAADEASRLQSELIRRVLPTVVNIAAHARLAPVNPTMDASAGDTGESFEFKSSAGTGFVVDADGTILTNWHVVDGAFEIFVTFSDGTRLDAEVLSATRIVDLALLKVTATHPLQAVTWGDLDKVQVGDSVLAIGNPLGIGTSVSRGIVSALHRNINDTPIDDFIQTDAAINHGNSGGPMFNMDGEVIGVDSAIISPTAANAGLGFALPAYQAQFMIQQMKKYGWVRPGWLGVKVQDVTDDIAKAVGMTRPHGSIVAWVSADGPAERAGLQVGDVILRFEEDTPADERAFLRDMTGSSPGRHVTLGLIRDGREMELPVTIEEWPRANWEGIAAAVRVPPPHWVIPADLGISVALLTPKLLAENGMPPDLRGVLVTEVRQGTDAARRGLMVGDVIMRVGKAPVDDMAALLHEVDAIRKSGHDLANILVFPKNRAHVEFPAPKWIPLRVGAG